MPLQNSSYLKRPFHLASSHLETIIPSLFYKVDDVHYDRERLELEDGDFLDIDWIRNANSKLLILSHGLEGNSERHYIQRSAKFFSNKGWDIMAWNNRGCSGEMNRLPRFYHHGATEDIASIIDRGLSEGYKEIVLIGYSMGGGMQQKYLGEREIDERIKGAISFSVPCNVQNSADMLNKGFSRMYEKRFVSKLTGKILAKSKILEMNLDMEQIENVKNFRQLDEAFTLKMHPEFKNTEDFYSRITSDQYLDNITVPLLIVNAKNDPMLGDKCYPVELAKQSELIHLEIPEQGGHIGFTIFGNEFSYMEYASGRFINEIIFG